MKPEKIFTSSKTAINDYEGPEYGPHLVLLHGVTGTWRLADPCEDRESI